MARRLGSALAGTFGVLVFPDTKTFTAKLRGELAKDKTTKEVPITADTKPFDRKKAEVVKGLAALTARRNDIKLDVLDAAAKLKVARFDAAMKRVDRIVANPRVREAGIDGALITSLSLEATLDRIDGKKVTVDVEVKKGALSKLRGLIPGAGGAAAGAAEGGGGLARGALPLVGALPPQAQIALIGAALAALPLIAQAAAGGIVFALGGALAAVGIIGAAKAKVVQDAFAKLGTKASADIAKIGKPFIGVLTSVAATASKLLDTMTPVFAAAIKGIAGPFKAFADALISAFGTPAVKQSIQDVADAFGKLLTALTPSLAGDVRNVASGISKIADAVGKNPEAFRNFISFLFAAAGGVLTAIASLAKFASYVQAHFLPAVHEIAVVFDGVRHEVAHGWDVLFDHLIGTQIRFGHNAEHAWSVLVSDLVTGFDIFKNGVIIAWDRIKLTFLGGVRFILTTMGKLPGPLGAPFRAAAKDIGGSMAGIRRDVQRRTGQIQADINRLHGKTLKITMQGNGFVKITEGKATFQISQGAWNSPHAAGGFISGGVPGRDSVHGLLMPGEVVVPTKMVQAGAVDHLRGRLPGFKSGGVVRGYASGGLAGSIDTWPHQMAAQHQARSQADMSKAMRSAMVLALNAAVKAAKAASTGGGGGFPGGGSVGAGAAAAMRYAQSILGLYGWGQNQFPPLRALWMGESGWNYRAYNASSGATGIPQSLPGSKMASAGADWRTNPATQIRWGLGYIRSVYGSPAVAYSRWLGRSPHWYGQGGEVDGYASGGTVAQRGQKYLSAWRSRHGGGFGAAWGPVVLSEQIARMSAAASRAGTLSHAGGLSAGQHRFWAGAAADEKKRLAVLKTELGTERAWRFQLGLRELSLDRQIRAAGNLPGLARPVRGWKSELRRDRAKVAQIDRMVGHTNAYLAAHRPPRKVTPPGVPGSIPHTGVFTDRTADLIAQLFAALASNSRVVTFDRGGWLQPGLTMAYNGTGRAEPVGRGGGGDIHIHVENTGVIGSQAQLRDWLVRSTDELKRQGRI